MNNRAVREVSNVYSDNMTGDANDGCNGWLEGLAPLQA